MAKYETSGNKRDLAMLLSVTTHDKMGERPDIIEKWIAMPLRRMVAIGWKVVL